MFERYMAWSILIALMGAGSYLLVRRGTGVKNQKKQIQLKTEVRKDAQQLDASCVSTMDALGVALDLKSPELRHGSQRVTAFAIAIARALGLPREETKIIARGAFLHDIGKISIPDSILRKPGALTPEESAMMRKHSDYGYQIVKKVPSLLEVAEIVYAHQECFDGAGYPRGLRGEEIPLGARIVAVAATLDAITSDRPGRRAQSVQAALDEIDRCSGRQFDPKVVEAFLSMPENIWEDLRKEIDSPPS